MRAHARRPAPVPLPDPAPEADEPRWAAVADGVALAALGLAVVLAAGGGFRIWVGGVRIAVTSPVTPALLALLLVGIRHRLHPRPHLGQRCRRWAWRLRRSDRWRAAWPPFVATRAAVLGVGLLAVVAVGYPPGEPRVRLSANEAVNLPMRWDAGWYHRIARGGYEWNPGATGQQTIVFFPAFPMAMRVVGRVFGGGANAYAVAGVLLSHAAWLWALLLFYDLARVALVDEARARTAVWLLAAYPFALFYGAIYTEAFYLLGAVGAVLEAHRGRMGRACLWGLLAGLTRPNGFLVSAMLAALAANRRVRISWATAPHPLIRYAAVVLAPVAGTALYSAYVGTLTGNPLQWWVEQAAWGRTLAEPAVTQHLVDTLTAEGLAGLAAARPYDAINATAGLVALGLAIPVGLRLGPAYALLIVVNLVPPLLMGGAVSLGRFTATLFPLFLWMAAVLPRGGLAVGVAFATLQGFAAVIFYTWRPLY